MAEKLPSYGGQALIEGVLMRGSRALAAAMRAPDGKIVIETELLKGIYASPIAKIPFLRGLVILWDALGLGYRYLTNSANVQAEEGEKIEGTQKATAMGIALVFFVLVFILGPSFIADLIRHFLGASLWMTNLLEGIIRLGLILAYLWLIGKMPEITRVFSYHGAEHKTINAFEGGAELTPENVSHYSLEHPRCGTSFLLTLVILTIIVFALLGPIPLLPRYLLKIVSIPLLAGVAYEYIRWMANHLTSPLVRLLIKPNLALQKLTTREPSLDMLEVSIASFNAMLALELGQPVETAQKQELYTEQAETTAH